MEVALPELIECRNHWHTWSDYMKGHKMGYMIGKYTITVFSYVSLIRGVSIFNQLRRANIMAILQRFPRAKGHLILQESAKCVPKNTYILKKAFNGSVIAHNPNVVPHVMQRKHRWDKFVYVTGNTEVDFKKVTTFLEEIEILKCERELDFSFKSVKTYIYRKKMGDNTIIAVFEVNKSNLPLLRDAWVQSKIPNAP